MKIYFSVKADKSLMQWLGPRTWDSKHPLDMERFYRFLMALNRYSRGNWSKDFQENLSRAAQAVHGGATEERLRFFTEKADTVYDYEQVR